MRKKLLIDTDVIIDYLRDYDKAVKFLETQNCKLLISTITISELYAGVREGEEKAKLEEFLKAFEIIEVNKDIAIKGGLFRRDHEKKYGTGLTDALIAAAADDNNAILVTLNKKHYPMISKILIPYRK